jgi:hypothetical protein
VQKVKKWYAVYPFWVRIEIPHFPEETTYETAHPQCQERPPVGFCDVLKERTMFQPDVEGFQNKIYGKPDKRKKVAGPEEHECEHTTACDKESD